MTSWLSVIEASHIGIGISVSGYCHSNIGHRSFYNKPKHLLPRRNRMLDSWKLLSKAVGGGLAMAGPLFLPSV